MAWGGKRAGAGKPKGHKAAHTLEAQEARKNLIAKYISRQDEIDNALLDKAASGDVPAIKEVYDRVYNKALQGIEMTGKDGKDLFEPSDKIKQLAAALNELHRQGTSTGG